MSETEDGEGKKRRKKDNEDKNRERKKINRMEGGRDREKKGKQINHGRRRESDKSGKRKAYIYVGKQHRSSI